jgi:Peptide methionine sulfoxide reductase
MNKIGFGGGCHWCTEAIFQSLHGVEQVEQGWITSTPPFDTYSEGVIVHYGSDIPLDRLIEVHLLSHSSTSLHSMRKKYRSAVYYFNVEDKRVIEEAIRRIELDSETCYITQALPFVTFKENTKNYLNYYKKTSRLHSVEPI